MAKPQKIGKKKKTPPASGKKSGHSERIAQVMMRNDFYSDGYKTMRLVAFIQFLVVVAVIVGVVYFVNSHKTEHVYFATTDDGRMVTIVPINRPNLTTPALMSWAAQASTEVMTFGYHDYRRRLNESSRHFTRIGWDSFMSALDKARIIEMVENQQMVVTSSPRSAPIILSEGVVNGRYQWVIQLPISVSYQAAGKNKAEKFLIDLTIVRVPQLENPNGVGIERWFQRAG